MSILERFADQVLLTIATTHLGELKTLKYRCVMFPLFETYVAFSLFMESHGYEKS